MESWMALVDGTKLTGMMKVWVYQHMVASKMSWGLMIHDIPPSWVDENIQPLVDRMLKKWTGLARAANTNIFYRAKKHYGLHLTHMVDFTKRLQVIRCHLLKHSKDPRVVEVYRAKEARHAAEVDSLRMRWRPTKALSKAEAAVAHQKVVGTACVGRQGLGYGVRQRTTTSDPRQEHRKSVCHQLELEAENLRYVEESDHIVQGGWQRWQELAAADLSWNRLLYTLSPDAVKFMLNATMDTCPSPANLERWKQIHLGRCELCGSLSGNLQHILNVCSVALRTHRYTWRHDSVLKIVEQYVQIAVNRAKALRKKGGRPTHTINFVKVGDPKCAKKKLKARPETVLEEADDWQTVFDLRYDEQGAKHKMSFPVEVLATTLMPDGVIWSSQQKQIILLELSVSWEENHVAANLRKKLRYEQLEALLAGQGWKVQRFEFEVGSRGYLSPTVSKMLKALGLNRQEAKSARGRMENTAVLCSYIIFTSRKSPLWHQTTLMAAHMLSADN